MMCREPTDLCEQQINNPGEERKKSFHKAHLSPLALRLSVFGCNKIITRLITWLMSSDRALEGQLSQLGITEEPLKE
jgi:hypothetical protein